MEANVLDSSLIREMKLFGRRYMESIDDDLSPTMEQKIAVFLHPMLKQLRMATDSEKMEVHAEIKSLIDSQEMYRDNAELESSAEVHTEMYDGSCLFEEFLSDSQHDAEVGPEEFERYINFKFDKVFVEFETNPLIRNNQHE